MPKRTFSLKVHLSEGQNIRGKNGSIGNPCCKLFLSGKLVGKSKSIRQIANPVWDEEFSILSQAAEEDILLVEIWDKQKTKKEDSLIGQVAVSLSDFVRKKRIDRWYDLEQGGKVFLGIEPIDFGSLEGNLVPPQDNSDPEHSWTIKTVNNCRIVSASEAIPLIEYSDK